MNMCCCLIFLWKIKASIPIYQLACSEQWSILTDICRVERVWAADTGVTYGSRKLWLTWLKQRNPSPIIFLAGEGGDKNPPTTPLFMTCIFPIYWKSWRVWRGENRQIFFIITPGEGRRTKPPLPLEGWSRLAPITSCFRGYITALIVTDVPYIAC